MRFQNKNNVCLESDCDNPAKTKGLCIKHYGRLLRNGASHISRIQNDLAWRNI